MSPPAADPIDHVLTLDPGRRGVAALARPGAALAAARALRRARRVLIVTGFAVRPGVPETDGPPGAAVLGRALRTLGARVAYTTDRPNVAVVQAALAALGEPRLVRPWPDGPGAARALLAAERPTHLVAVERPGRTRAGEYLSMRGESVAAWTAPLDDLFLGRPRAVTVAIGDGGNEVGMGALRARLARLGRLPARIASVVPARHLVVAGVSNWGAWGVAAALSRLARRDLLHTPADEARLLAACVAAGAYDGVTRRPEPTVDGLPLAVHQAVLTLLRFAALSGIMGSR